MTARIQSYINAVLNDTLDEYYEGKRRNNWKGTYKKKSVRMRDRYEKGLRGEF